MRLPSEEVSCGIHRKDRSGESALHAQKQSLGSSSRWNLKYGLNIFGKLKTTCRWGTGRSTFSWTNSAQSSARLVPQLGQKPLVLQLSARSFSHR